jgi:hypothetical protein
MLRTVGLFLLALLFTIQPAQPVSAQSRLELTSPSDGEVIQGLVPVMGSIHLDEIRSGEVSFAYNHNPTDTWFLIGQFEDPPADGLLATWDTTTIADGIYTLRVRVELEDGEVLFQFARGLRVRNYTPVETATPAPTTSAASPVTTETPAPVANNNNPAATPLPTNPAVLTPTDLTSGMVNGAIAVGGIFLIVGIYLAVRKQVYRA